MPEAPEVSRYADELDRALTGKTISSLTAGTKNARVNHEGDAPGGAIAADRRERARITTFNLITGVL